MIRQGIECIETIATTNIPRFKGLTPSQAAKRRKRAWEGFLTSLEGQPELLAEAKSGGAWGPQLRAAFSRYMAAFWQCNDVDEPTEADYVWHPRELVKRA